MSIIRKLLSSIGILEMRLESSSERSKDDSFQVTKEFDYMLSELKRESDLINERQRRLEQVVAFYIAILTALIAAAVAGVTRTSGTTQIVTLLGGCLLATAVGHVTFIALLLKLAEVIASHSHFYVRRQYFLDKFPHVRRYAEHPRPEP